ncbi:MFS transporter [Nocardioides sp. 31GB23]|uniref:Benzoate transport n=1 Tax=Nocardioides salarius TaxID=374513 RepID=A0ABS2M9G7_9ACTN|nr:MFS transporter [Nocardioides salarius]MBM7507835.1 benzoate transport [Nocardioides salarius]
MSTPVAPPAPTLRARIDAAPMSRFQWGVIALCTLLNTLDGFDVMAMAFTAAGVGSTFALSGTQIGLLLSAGLVGMAAGSMLIAPLADSLGRRTVVLACVALSGIGMVGSALAPTALTLGGTRVLTGLGVGGILACTNVIASEFANARSRGLSIGIYTAGYGVGAMVGGLAAVALQDSFGWRGVFWTGATLTLGALVVLVRLLPESVDLMVHRGRDRDLARVNATLVRMRQEPLTSLSAATTDTGTATGADTAPRVRLSALLTGGQHRSTLLVWLAFFCTMFGFYFVNSWTPTLLADAGLSSDQAAGGGIALAIGGALGSILYGVVTARADQRLVLIGFTLLAAVAMATLVLSTAVLVVALFVGVLVGALVNGCVAGLYTVTPALYGTRTRGTGMGWAIGIGRIGAILAPLVTGRLVDADWGATQLYVGAALVLSVSAIAVALLPRGGSARPAGATRRAVTVRA